MPYPYLKFLVSAVSPIIPEIDLAPRRLSQIFTDAFNSDMQLIRSDPRRDVYLACALMVRGKDIAMSDVRQFIDKIDLRFVHWNTEGWKVGLCNMPSLHQPQSLLCVGTVVIVQYHE